VLRFCSLGSGSEGNALVVEARCGGAHTRVLLDNGFGPAQLKRRLARAGIGIDDLDAIVLTHEHSDHVGGVAALRARRRIPVYCSAGTARAAAVGGHGVTTVVDGEVVAIGAVELRAFEVAHDAAEPLHYVFGDGDRRLGVLTDIGAPGDGIEAALAGVDALVLECNHDVDMLRASAYPAFLKARILGGRGHLSNAQAAGLLQRLDRRRLRLLVAAHLSRRNNLPRLAREALAQAAGSAPDDVLVADQDDGLDWQVC
jgi:phosphoribosyl 1,2-cyclic phosphodiesterase